MTEFDECLVDELPTLDELPSLYEYPSLYWASRPWPCLWNGLPALFCMIAGFSTVAIVRRPSEGELATRLQTAATAAHDSQQEATEDLCRRRLLVLQPTDPRIRFEYAVALSHHGENDRATRIILSLAPLDRTGFAPAHYWLAEQMMNAGTRLSTAQTDLLKRRLEFSLVGRDPVPAARFFLVDLAFRSRQWDVASEHLKVVVSRRPDLLMYLAFALRLQGNEIQARSTAERAANFFAGLVRENPQDEASRLLWSEALVFQNYLKEAIQVLQDADVAGEDPRFGAAIAQIFLLRMSNPGLGLTVDEMNAPADALLPANRPESALELTTRIELLAQALHYGPHHPPVLNEVAQLATEESPDGDQARAWLKDILASGKAPATVHLILGTAAASKGDLAEAKFHLEQAHQRDPRLAEAANNLAYVLAHTDPPRIEQALVLIESALQVMPQHPRMHETRGQILLMLGRHKEAILDLEYVLETMPNHIQAHRGLATAYLTLGDPGLANLHRQIADKLQDPKPKR